MRQIGHLDDERQAWMFADYLYSVDIEGDVEPEGARWVVWVRDEDQVEAALTHLEAFRRSPGDARYAKASRLARQKREAAEQESAAAEKRYFDRDRIFPDRAALGPLTLALIGLSILATAVTGFGKGSAFPDLLAFSAFVREGDYVRYPAAWVAMTGWEVWRWVTPILVHMSFTHALFNMVMLGDLGGRVEARLGGWRFLGLVVLFAVPSNVAQFLVSGPLFGGMSGVLYGLFGYCWMRGRMDPQSGYFIHPTSVGILLAWYFLCLFGLIQNVANTVHTVGLGLGVVCGLAAGWLRR